MAHILDLESRHECERAQAERNGKKANPWQRDSANGLRRYLRGLDTATGENGRVGG